MLRDFEVRKPDGVPHADEALAESEAVKCLPGQGVTLTILGGRVVLCHAPPNRNVAATVAATKSTKEVALESWNAVQPRKRGHTIPLENRLFG